MGKALPFVLHHPDRGPQQVHVDCLYLALREDGQVVGLTCFATDVTELVRLRQAVAGGAGKTAPPPAGPVPTA